MPAKKIAKKAVAAAPKKAAKKASPRKRAARKAAAPAPPGPSFEDIASAAFLNHLRRVAAGLPDDPTADWLEAERVLRAAAE